MDSRTRLKRSVEGLVSAPTTCYFSGGAEREIQNFEGSISKSSSRQGRINLGMILMNASEVGGAHGTCFYRYVAAVLAPRGVYLKRQR